MRYLGVIKWYFDEYNHGIFPYHGAFDAPTLIKPNHLDAEDFQNPGKNEWSRMDSTLGVKRRCH